MLLSRELSVEAFEGELDAFEGMSLFRGASVGEVIVVCMISYVCRQSMKLQDG